MLPLFWLVLVCFSSSHLDSESPISSFLVGPKYWDSICFYVKVLGSVISPSSPVGNLLTASLVDAMGNVVCIVSIHSVRVILCSPCFWQMSPCSLTKSPFSGCVYKSILNFIVILVSSWSFHFCGNILFFFNDLFICKLNQEAQHNK